MYKEFINWNQIEYAVADIANFINNGNYSNYKIIGLPRGGLIPAVLLSHRTSLPLITKPEINDHLIIIDDIIDSGETIIKTVNELKNWGIQPVVCSLYYRLDNGFTPDWWVHGIKNDDPRWIQFPWELSASQTIADYKNK